jgi:hypothetical protein
LLKRLPAFSLLTAEPIELAEHFGGRVKGSIEAIKRAVYFGGYMSLALGLRMEHIEFLGDTLIPPIRYLRYS